MSLSKGFTDDWDIHLQANELEELETVNVGHENIADNQVKLVIPVLPLPEHVQCRLRLHHCCHCIAIIPTKKRGNHQKNHHMALTSDQSVIKESEPRRHERKLTIVVVAKL